MDHKPKQGETANRRLELSVPQVAGSTLAAVAAAVLASQLGVYGTILGAGVVSVVATCGGPVFQHLFRRTGEQIRDATVQSKRRQANPASEGIQYGEYNEATTHGTRMRGWKRSALAAGVVFAVAMGGITAYELASGSELGGGKGTTIGSVVTGGGGSGGGSPSGGTSSTDSPPPAPGDDDGGGDPNSRPGQEEGQGQTPGGGQSPDAPDGSGGDPTTGPDPEPTPDPSASSGGDPSPTPTPTPPSTPTPPAQSGQSGRSGSADQSGGVG
ncbi:hypothetical protein [Streptomyces sp. PR69]|uniref:hypothetical protein n=1 Tax=Streptomyces sp. PR69 TaxID=2984950 RepID=UPI0022652D96|nr:hypothetical protein [Streptomyces sp. PR69]